MTFRIDRSDIGVTDAGDIRDLERQQYNRAFLQQVINFNNDPNEDDRKLRLGDAPPTVEAAGETSEMGDPGPEGGHDVTAEMNPSDGYTPRSSGGKTYAVSRRGTTPGGGAAGRSVAMKKA